MFERIKTIFTTLKYAWKYSDVMTSALKCITTFPGVDESEKLRSWLRPVILDLSVLTSLTRNTIDDAVARSAIRIIDSDRSWDAVYALLMLTQENTSHGAVKIPMAEMRSDTFDSLHDIVDDVPVENPAVIIAAIGLIIQLIQLLKK
jgi:thioredoxin-like negative regulator of GroEL